MSEDGVNKALRLIELSYGASLEEVTKSYKELIKIWHPDRYQHDQSLKSRAEKKTKELNAAIELLKKSYDPKKKLKTKVEQTVSKPNPGSNTAQHFSKNNSARVNQFSKTTVYNFSDPTRERIAELVTVVFSLLAITAVFENFQVSLTIQIILQLIVLFAINRAVGLVFDLLGFHPKIRISQLGIESSGSRCFYWREIFGITIREGRQRVYLVFNLNQPAIKKETFFDYALYRIRKFLRLPHVSIRLKTRAFRFENTYTVIRNLIEINSQSRSILEAQNKTSVRVVLQLILIAAAATPIFRSLIGLEHGLFEMYIYFSIFAVAVIGLRIQREYSF